MHRVRLIHWNATEAEEWAARLQAEGYDVEYALLSPSNLRALRAEPPDAVVVDLSRIPSQGRDTGVGLRIHKATRYVPLVFVGGAPEKVEIPERQAVGRGEAVEAVHPENRLEAVELEQLLEDEGAADAGSDSGGGCRGEVDEVAPNPEVEPVGQHRRLGEPLVSDRELVRFPKSRRLQLQ